MLSPALDVELSGAISASKPMLRSWNVRSWIVCTRLRSSSSDHLWQVWRARLSISSGLCSW
jgi:hypothetical protein